MLGLLIKANQLFVTIASYWASVNVEFNLPTSLWLLAIDRLTIGWSVVIIITSSIKILDLHNLIQLQTTETNSTESLKPPTARDLLILNFMPQINDFGKLYFGVTSVTTGSALVWRIYLNFIRPNLGHHNRGPPASGSELFNPKREVVEFFKSGPQTLGEPRARHLRRRRRAVKPTEQTAGSWAWHWSHKVATLHPDRQPRQGQLLAKIHGSWRRKWRESQLDWSQAGCRPEEEEEEEGKEEQELVLQVYRIPIRSADFLHDRSQARWNFLARQVYAFCASCLIMSSVNLYYIVRGLHFVLVQFGPQTGSGPLANWLFIYGALEQIYAITQAMIFFVFTNIFITLFHADLVYKMRPIRREIRILSHLYNTMQLETIPLDQVRREQIRLWAYFDNIHQIDAFVSRFSLISMLTLIIGLSFGQSYLRVSNTSLKTATAFALLSNLMSFTYLHLISWSVEQIVSGWKSSPALSSQRDLLTKRMRFETIPFQTEQACPKGHPVDIGAREVSQGQEGVAKGSSGLLRPQLEADLYNERPISVELAVILQG